MYFLGIDFGGSSSKATLIDEKGKIIASSSCEYVTYYGDDGEATQKPESWIFSLKSVIDGILKCGADPEDIECLCIDAATHTAVLLDENDNAIFDAVYWTDTRSIREKQYLLENYSDYIFEKSKHYPDTIWTLVQLLFLKNNFKEKYQKIKHILFEKDYIRYFFVKKYVTDYIEAQGSMLFDFDNNVWDEKLLEIVDLNIDQLPEIISPLDIIGNISEEASALTGLSTNTKVICGSTDTAMEVFASGGVEKGDMTLKLATAGRICIVSDKPYPDKNIINYSHLSKGLFYPGSGTKSCAASNRWFRDTFGQTYEELDNLAKDIPVGSNGLIFHPYLQGELTPYANPNIRGSFFGISSLHTKGHFVRSLYEGVGFSLLDCYLYLKEKGLQLSKRAYAIGGGSKSKTWSQIISDILGIELVITQDNDSSFGSALCASIVGKAFKNLKEAKEKSQKIICIVKPNMTNHEKYLEIYKKYKMISNFTLEYYKDE